MVATLYTAEIVKRITSGVVKCVGLSLLCAITFVFVNPLCLFAASQSGSIPTQAISQNAVFNSQGNVSTYIRVTNSIYNNIVLSSNNYGGTLVITTTRTNYTASIATGSGSSPSASLTTPGLTVNGINYTGSTITVDIPAGTTSIPLSSYDYVHVSAYSNNNMYLLVKAQCNISISWTFTENDPPKPPAPADPFPQYRLLNKSNFEVGARSYSLTVPDDLRGADSYYKYSPVVVGFNAPEDLVGGYLLFVYYTTASFVSSSSGMDYLLAASHIESSYFPDSYDSYFSARYMSILSEPNLSLFKGGSYRFNFNLGFLFNLNQNSSSNVVTLSSNAYDLYTWIYWVPDDNSIAENVDRFVNDSTAGDSISDSNNNLQSGLDDFNNFQQEINDDTSNTLDNADLSITFLGGTQSSLSLIKTFAEQTYFKSGDFAIIFITGISLSLVSLIAGFVRFVRGKDD